MPAAFDNCVKSGGKVRTISGPRSAPKLAAGEYMHICTVGGQTYFGHRKKRKEKVK